MNETKFIEILNDFYLEQINNSHTRENNVLDLLITSIPDKIMISEVLKPADTEISTDHNLIMFDLIMACNSLPKTIRSIFNYPRADFNGLRAYLRSVNLQEKISDHGDINKDWSDWKDARVSCCCEKVCSYCKFKRSKASSLNEQLNSSLN